MILYHLLLLQNVSAFSLAQNTHKSRMCSFDIGVH